MVRCWKKAESSQGQIMRKIKILVAKVNMLPGYSLPEIVKGKLTRTCFSGFSSNAQSFSPCISVASLCRWSDFILSAS
ncbi:hypothetical protein Pat9b_5009 (plasmid) [Pantoea sp. At-9b]|nr:hypothetical protein Pat9b_5009 [Pantoea sp. At-9b]